MDMKALRYAAGATAIAVAGCVTINIYFPAAAAEKAADRIIDEVWQTQKQEGRPEGKPKADGDSKPSAQPTQ